MKVIVVEAHRSNYPNPIHFKTGDVLRLGRVDTEFPDWVRTTTVDGNEGWAPMQYVHISESDPSRGTALFDYTAFELNTEVGEVLVVIRELNEWYWVENTSGVEGWVPANTTNKFPE